MYLGDMTWNEVQHYISHVNNNLVLPVGTCEQHGYHLPLNNDVLLAEYLAKLLCEHTGALLAPTIHYGVNLPCDKFLAGTTSVTKDILQNTIKSLAEWWQFQGINNILIITYHGDPFHLEAMQSISSNIILYDVYEIEYHDILERQTTIRHACEAETSVALYLYPEKVRFDQIQEHDIPYEQFKEYLFHEKVNKPEGYVGCLGYPSAATAEKGKIIVDRMVNRMLKECTDILKAL